MKSTIIMICLCLGAVCWGSLAFAGEDGFKVVVNASNPSDSLSRKDVSKLFLKKVTKWEESGEKVEPVELVDDSELREYFSEKIHGRKVSSIKSYWQKKIFSGRGVPPLEKESEEELLEFVGKHAGAIGYVSEEADMSAYEVKVLDVRD